MAKTCGECVERGRMIEELAAKVHRLADRNAELAGEVADKFANWPENLPREDLIRLLRGFANLARKVEQTIAAAFPDEYPLGDGDIIPSDQRIVVDGDALLMAEKVVAEVARLRSTGDGAADVRVEWGADLDDTEDSGPTVCGGEWSARVLAEREPENRLLRRTVTTSEWEVVDR